MAEHEIDNEDLKGQYPTNNDDREFLNSVVTFLVSNVGLRRAMLDTNKIPEEVYRFFVGRETIIKKHEKYIIAYVIVKVK